jgi:lysophospholipase L1-like esterase
VEYLAISLAVVALFLVIYLRVGRYVLRTQVTLPPNNPRRFASVILPSLPAPRGKIVVCAGDSITHGRVSANYVDLLAARYPEPAWTFVNAGVNNELAWNLGLRIDGIAACEPDYVTVLIGTNDVNASFGVQNLLEYFADQSLPERPTPEFFSENLTLIARRLKKKTRAKVALLSLPTYGEDLDCYRAVRVSDYSKIVKSVAEAEGCDYLPLNEKMTAFLASSPRPARPQPDERDAAKVAAKASMEKLFRNGSFAEISERNGFLLHVDFLHLNETGSAMVADLVAKFLDSPNI